MSLISDDDKNKIQAKIIFSLHNKIHSYITYEELELAFLNPYTHVDIIQTIDSLIQRVIAETKGVEEVKTALYEELKKGFVENYFSTLQPLILDRKKEFPKENFDELMIKIKKVNDKSSVELDNTVIEPVMNTVALDNSTVEPDTSAEESDANKEAHAALIQQQFHILMKKRETLEKEIEHIITQLRKYPVIKKQRIELIESAAHLRNGAHYLFIASIFLAIVSIGLIIAALQTQIILLAIAGLVAVALTLAAFFTSNSLNNKSGENARKALPILNEEEHILKTCKKDKLKELVNELETNKNEESLLRKNPFFFFDSKPTESDATAQVAKPQDKPSPTR